MADMNGAFKIQTRRTGKITLRITCMGYAPKEVVIDDKRVDHIKIKLRTQSVALDEFVVTARYDDKTGGDVTVDKEAIEYIQPTSLRDVLSLLPGGKMGSNNMQGGVMVSSRQAGVDKSTSFGMGLMIDGIPIHNDGMRIQMTGLTGQSSMDKDANIMVNTGVDLRTVSTDHIESVTVTRGISSAREGNLSSGAIKVKVKKGVSPLRIRVKADPKNKLLYVGRGFDLGRQTGTLYAGMDITRSCASTYDTRGAYNRITGRLNYTGKFNILDRDLDLGLSGSYVTSFNNRKTDAIIQTFKEKYNTRQSRAAISARASVDNVSKLFDKLETVLSADYSTSILKHHKHVLNQSVTPMQTFVGEGQHEGLYLPSVYDTYYEIENLPLNFFSELSAEKYINIGDNSDIKLLTGASYTAVKNFGRGTIVNPERPPFPSSDCIRPRRNKDIPALMHEATYIEGRIKHRIESHETVLSSGLRQVMMFNLPSDYELNHKILLEPRIQASHTYTCNIFGKKASTTLRAGWGVESKLPSVDYLYPDKVYHDFISLNHYANKPEDRLLITDTRIEDPANPEIRENKGRKFELGLEIETDKISLSLTAFKETMSGGIEYFNIYTPASYTYYYTPSHPIEGRPTTDDYESRNIRTFISHRTPTNSAKTIKKGIEYRLKFSRIKPLSSEIILNGAYYRTLYSDGVPVMYRPDIMSEGRTYPYVGIFDGYDKSRHSIFNTNMWINTHLKDWKLIFTNFIQVIWKSQKRLMTDVDVYPSQYMDTDGKIHELTHEQLLAHPELETMKRQFNSARFRPENMPISLRWNIKMTKEFSRRISLSLFADNIFQISPKYKNKYMRTVRMWHQPFFGTELTINLY